MGLAGSGRDWRPQIELLAARYDVIAPDLRGHGTSHAPSAPWHMADLARDVAEVLRTFGATPAHVVGLSLGGMVAFQLAVDSPALVRSLVIVNSGPAFPCRSWQGSTHLVPSGHDSVARDGADGPRNRATAIPQARPDYFGQRVPGPLINDPQHYANTLRAIRGFDVLERLGEVRCPGLAISGDATTRRWRPRRRGCEPCRRLASRSYATRGMPHRSTSRTRSLARW